jgi:hypothetical protein
MPPKQEKKKLTKTWQNESKCNTESKKIPMLVAHTCNPSYSVERYQENHGLKQACANSS